LQFKVDSRLFKEVIKAGLIPAVATVEALAAEPDLPSVEQLRRYLATWQRVMAEAPLGDLLKLLAAETGNFPEASQWLRESVVRPARQVIIGIVETGIAGGDFRAISAETVADILASPLCFYALRDIWGGLSSPDRFLGEAFDMLIRGLGAASAG